MKKQAGNEFERAASEQSKKGLLNDFWQLLLHNKKWWLLPILIVFALLGSLIFLSGTALAPFIYTLF